MPKSMRAGSMLAGRYRLVDLLSESRGAHFWRAWDTVLSRHVAVHLIANEDERSDALMDAARRSATLFDPHLLRVLDADHTNGICFVVNEWGEGESLDRLAARGAAGAAAGRLAGARDRHHDRHRARQGHRPRPAGAGERAHRRGRLGQGDRLRRRRRAQRDAGGPAADRRGRPRRRPLRGAHRQVARDLALRRTPGSAGARPGAAAPPGPRRGAPGARRAVRRGAESLPGGARPRLRLRAGDRRRARGVRRGPHRRRRRRGGPPARQHQPADPADRGPAGARPGDLRGRRRCRGVRRTGGRPARTRPPAELPDADGTVALPALPPETAPEPAPEEPEEADEPGPDESGPAGRTPRSASRSSTTSRE